MFGNVIYRSDNLRMQMTFDGYTAQNVRLGTENKNKARFRFSARNKSGQMRTEIKHIKNSQFIKVSETGKPDKYYIAESAFNKLFKSHFDPNEPLNNGYGHKTWMFEPVKIGVEKFDKSLSAEPKMANRRPKAGRPAKAAVKPLRLLKEPPNKKSEVFDIASWISD